MFGNLMDKLQDAQGDVNKRLESMIVEGSAENGKVRVAINGLKKIQQISIADEFFIQGDKEAVEELVMLACNRAIEQAERLHESEMKNLAGTMMPGLSGMFGK